MEEDTENEIDKRRNTRCYSVFLGRLGHTIDRTPLNSDMFCVLLGLCLRLNIVLISVL